MPPRMIGTVNGFTATQAKCGQITFTHDGTVKGMVSRALEVGLVVGDIVDSGDWGTHKLIVAPGDYRCNEVWADRIWEV